MKNPAAARAEEAVLGLMLLHEDLRTYAQRMEKPLTEEDFYTEFGKKVFRYLISEEREAARDINEIFSSDEIGRITRMKVQRMQLTENGESVFRESVDNLRDAVKGQLEKENGLTIESLSDLINRRKTER